ncbi:unnamed protein product [Scytosiphon promiscuus]
MSTENNHKRPATEQVGESKKPCPDKYEHPPSRRGIIVDLVVEKADDVVEFMSKAIGAKEYFRYAGEDGKVMNLALDVDGVALWVEEIGNHMDNGDISTQHARLHLHTDDPVSVSAKLMEHGAKELTKMEKQFWGAVYGAYKDPFGLIWSVAKPSTALHDVPKELEQKVVPFVSVRDCDKYMTFLTEVFGAVEAYPASKDPNGKIMCAEMKMNGGAIMVGDHCGPDADKTEAVVTVSYEVGKDKAAPIAEAFKANGGEIVSEVSMQFWGQVWGRCKDPFGQTWGICEAQSGPPPSDEEMAIDMKIGAKYDWKYNWVVEDVPTVYCYGEVRTCTATTPEISKEMKTMLPAAFGGAAKAGLEVNGPPVSAYFVWESAPGGIAKFTSGPSVVGGDGSAAAALAKDPAGDDTGLGVRTAGGCKCVMAVHTGPYEEMMKCYKATFEWIEAKGYESRMPVFEVYPNDPKDTPPEKLVTKIYIPIVRKA